MKKISWNLNTYCDLTSFEVKKLHVFAQFFYRQLVFLVALQNHYMQKVTWDHCRCPFSQGWHLKKKDNIRCSEKHMLNYLCAVPATSVEEQKKIAMTMIHHIKNSIFGLFFFFSNCTVCKISHPKKAGSQFKSDHLSFFRSLIHRIVIFFSKSIIAQFTVKIWWDTLYLWQFGENDPVFMIICGKCCTVPPTWIAIKDRMVTYALAATMMAVT